MIALSETLGGPGQRRAAASTRLTRTRAMATRADAAPSVPQMRPASTRTSGREPHAALEHVEGELALDLGGRAARVAWRSAAVIGCLRSRCGAEQLALLAVHPALVARVYCFQAT